ENGYGATARLLWSFPGQIQVSIPQGRLYPPGGTTADTQPPSVPSAIASSNITETTFTLLWNASTDNIGVTGYEVFRNGVSLGTTTATTFNVSSGLSPGTTYAMTVR